MHFLSDSITTQTHSNLLFACKSFNCEFQRRWPKRNFPSLIKTLLIHKNLLHKSKTHIDSVSYSHTKVGGSPLLLYRHSPTRQLSTASETHQTNKVNGPSSSSSLLSCVLLVAGTTVGAGMLALPAVTAPAGFLASAASLTAFCMYTVLTGLLIAEVTINIKAENSEGSDPETPPLSLTSMASKLLGGGGKGIVIAPYLLLHYCVLVAHISRSSSLISSWTGTPLLNVAILFTATLGGSCFLLPSKAIDALNGVLVASMMASFGGLLALTVTSVQPQLLLTAPQWNAVLPAVPTIALAFVYQNIVPVVVNRVNGDATKVQASIVWGMFISLLMFLLWEAAILGTAPKPVDGSMASSLGVPSSTDPLVALQASSSSARPLIDTYSFFAIVTSFIGFVLALTEFIGDALRSTGDRSLASRHHHVLSPSSLTMLKSVQEGSTNHEKQPMGLSEGSMNHEKQSHVLLEPSSPAVTRSTDDIPESNYPSMITRHDDEIASSQGTPVQPTSSQSSAPSIWVFVMTLAPPFLFAQFNPSSFYAALDFAGTYGVMFLFGVLPSILAWRQRYCSKREEQSEESFSQVQLVPGGKVMLFMIGLIAATVICNQAVSHLSLILNMLQTKLLP
ncbi:hypothetical protein CEUSTIGMA_g760.t1 [Chlamydomonas eustigma]|uniref:Amino acid transporter transmembrane domain-containing protein n=1 Tax=Chlamydomonas eustigma TaxID=1157962 RepID=A0A250WRH9_9CHLO|nr:hypothetical protein CEUSTIGMA_g760.t1 [Chlamydomonas eustigma]|eukprot:GAX73306.1 hypothetical protein CEUSTIGMA_g760.t1 [Chlamydomonas eustigma]